VDNKPPQKVGQTPLKLEATELATLSDSFVVTIQKPGFKQESIFISSKNLPYKGEISANLTEEFAGAGTMNLQATMEEIARGVAQVQNLLRSRDYDQALNALSILISKYPSVATLYGLEGNIYYLQKNVDKALNAYQRANKLAANPETERMINRLEELRGGRMPSSVKGGER
jgi:tetratricopeptide (TPR) repeat protein